MKKGTAILLVIGILIISLGTIGIISVSTSSLSNTIQSCIQQLDVVSKYAEKTLGLFGFKSNYDLYIGHDLTTDEVYFIMVNSSNKTFENLGRYHHYSYRSYSEPVSVGLTNLPVSVISDLKVDMILYIYYLQSNSGEIYSFSVNAQTWKFYSNQTYNECIQKINESGYRNNSLHTSVYELIGTEYERSSGGGGPF